MGHDLRHSWRSLWRTRTQTVVAVVTLALAIGANASIFSLINSLVLRELPSPEPDRLVSVSMTNQLGDRVNVSVPMIHEIEARQQVLNGVVGWIGDLVLNTETDGQLGLANLWAVTGNFYSELRERPVLGRLLTVNDSNLRTLGFLAQAGFDATEAGRALPGARTVRSIKSFNPG